MIIKTITIDLWRPFILPIKINQYEAEGRTLVINLTAGGLPVNLSGAVVTFYAKKTDGNIVFNDCTVTDAANGQVSYEITGQTCILAGELQCFITITKSGPKVLRTHTFKITVNASDDVSEAVESTSEFTALTEALADLAAFISSGSLVQDENGLHLVGDEDSPAAASAYGWDGTNKGFLPFQKSIQFANSGIELDGDEATPDNGKFYGMLSGAKGYHNLPSVFGPETVANGNIAVFDGETGKLLKGGGKSVAQLSLLREYLTLTKSATQNIATSSRVAVTYDGSTAVNGTSLLSFDNANDRIVCQANCYLIIKAQAYLTDVTAGSYVILEVRKNGVAVWTCPISSNMTYACSNLETPPIEAAANDNFDVSLQCGDDAYTVSGSPLTYISAEAWAR